MVEAPIYGRGGGPTEIPNMSRYKLILLVDLFFCLFVQFWFLQVAVKVLKGPEDSGKYIV